MKLRIRDIDHVVLRVTDLDRAIRFYCDVLGCGKERRMSDLGLVQLRAGESLINLVDVSSPLGQIGGAAPGAEGQNMDHFSVRVDPFDEDAIHAHLKAHGVEASPTESRYGAQGTGPSIYIQDPDGNFVELKGPPFQTSSE